MNTAAMTLPRVQLLGEVERRIAQKMTRQAERDARFGADRVHLTSYMENIGWPELFGYRMPEYFSDAGFAIEQHLRQQIWWADNTDDDTLPSLAVAADVGMYWDMTLFGQRIAHNDIGVPEFLPHPFGAVPDVALLGHFDFYTTGDMPRLLSKYARMREVNAREYANRLEITFPCFQRGPLDIYVQLRGYEAFVDDLAERPEMLRSTLSFLVDERLRFAQARGHFLNEALPSTTFIADDWVNIPFISPATFRDILMPVYAHARAQEGLVTGFHTCGKMEAVAADLLAVFPEMDWLDVSGWNDVQVLDAAVDPRIKFHLGIINTVSLGDAPDVQRLLLEAIRRVSAHRPVSICAQAIVKLYPTYAEVLARLNRFVALAQRILYECEALPI